MFNEFINDGHYFVKIIDTYLFNNFFNIKIFNLIYFFPISCQI